MTRPYQRLDIGELEDIARRSWKDSSALLLILEELEQHFVCQALRRTRGNRARAARLLGMNRDQMRYRIKKFDLVEFQDDEA